MPDSHDPSDFSLLSTTLDRKARLRARVLTARRALPESVRSAADEAICRALAGFVRSGRPGSVAGYLPLPGEPGGPGLPAALTGTGAALLLPVLLTDRDLDWARYTGPDGLVPAAFGLREPAGTRLGTTAVAGVDLVVVPAVAVGADGVRLGRGGGSYDRALARVPPTTLVLAVLYDGELVDRVAAEPHDRRVGGVVTPARGVVRFG